MKLEFSDNEAEAVLRALDTGLKNIHIGGFNVIDGANIFRNKVFQGKQQEQQEKQAPPPPPA